MRRHWLSWQQDAYWRNALEEHLDAWARIRDTAKQNWAKLDPTNGTGIRDAFAYCSYPNYCQDHPDCNGVHGFRDGLCPWKKTALTRAEAHRCL